MQTNFHAAHKMALYKLVQFYNMYVCTYAANSPLCVSFLHTYASARVSILDGCVGVLVCSERRERPLSEHKTLCLSW